jgi:5-oxoprolinase (ATP-hydrolysing)
LAELSDNGRKKLLAMGFDDDKIECEMYLHMRYERTDCALMCMPEKSDDKNVTKYGDFAKSFQIAYKREFGFDIPGRKIDVDDVR